MTPDFGVNLGLNQVGDPVPDRLAYYQKLLAIGEGALSAMWVSDHLQKDSASVVEAWTTLTYLAALAPSYRVGHLVLSQSYRNPALLAKMSSTPQLLTKVFDGSYRFLADWLAAKAKTGEVPEGDFEAMTAIWLGAVESFWAMTHVYDNPPFGIDDERFIEQWVASLLVTLGARR